jgi:hypothetical protein
MKPVTRIVSLTFIVMAIVCFWLLPGVNTASVKKYTRVYEDTEFESADVILTEVIADTTEGPIAKIYKEESIIVDGTLFDLKAEMFSRAIHYEEELLVYDSAEVIDLTDLDSTYLSLQLDSLDHLQLTSIDSVYNMP